MPTVEYSRVVGLNNSVAHHILDGDIVSALELSLQASIIVRDMIRRNVQQQEREDHDSMTMMEQDDDHHIHQGLLLESPCIFLHHSESTTILSAVDSTNQEYYNVKTASSSATPSTDVLQNNKEVCYLHPHPIAIDVNRLDRLQTRLQQENVIAYTVLYNFGLCHHIFALFHSNNRASSRQQQQEDGDDDETTCRDSLRRAIIFYEYAHDILSSCDFLEEGDLIHSLLGIANNLGHAHHYLKDDEKATSCFERIWSILMYLQTEEITITVPSSTSEEGSSTTRLPLSLDGFLANASYHCIKAVAAPAA